MSLSSENKEDSDTIEVFEKREKIRLKIWLLKGWFSVVACCLLLCVIGIIAAIATGNDKQVLAIYYNLVGDFLKTMQVIFNTGTSP